MPLKSHLQVDKADEAKAVKTYGARQKQHPNLAPMFKEMQDDEKDHHNNLSKVIQGLKQVKP